MSPTPRQLSSQAWSARSRCLRRQLEEGGGEEDAAAVGRDGHALFDHLIRAQQQRWRDREADGPRGLEVHDQLQPLRPFDG
jgi:hypothetical protein